MGFLFPARPGPNWGYVHPPTQMWGRKCASGHGLYNSSGCSVFGVKHSKFCVATQDETPTFFCHQNSPFLVLSHTNGCLFSTAQVEHFKPLQKAVACQRGMLPLCGRDRRSKYESKANVCGSARPGSVRKKDKEIGVGEAPHHRAQGKQGSITLVSPGGVRLQQYQNKQPPLEIFFGLLKWLKIGKTASRVEGFVHKVKLT